MRRRAVGRNYVSAGDMIWPKSKSSPLFLQLFCVFRRVPFALAKIGKDARGMQGTGTWLAAIVLVGLNVPAASLDWAHGPLFCRQHYSVRELQLRARQSAILSRRSIGRVHWCIERVNFGPS